MHMDLQPLHGFPERLIMFALVSSGRLLPVITAVIKAVIEHCEHFTVFAWGNTPGNRRFFKKIIKLKISHEKQEMEVVARRITGVKWPKGQRGQRRPRGQRAKGDVPWPVWWQRRQGILGLYI